MHRYFVKIHDLSTDTIRNLAVLILDPTIGGEPIPDLTEMLPWWRSTQGAFDFVADGMVNILDFVLRESAEECLVQ